MIRKLLIASFLVFLVPSPGSGEDGVTSGIETIPRQIYLGLDVSRSTSQYKVDSLMRRRAVEYLRGEVQPGDIVTVLRFWDHVEVVTTVEIRDAADIDRVAKEITTLPLVANSENTYFAQVEEGLTALIQGESDPRFLQAVILLSDADSDFEEYDRPFTSLGEQTVREQRSLWTVGAGYLRVPLEQVGKRRSHKASPSAQIAYGKLITLLRSRVQIEDAMVSSYRPPLGNIIPGRIDILLNLRSEGGLARAVRIEGARLQLDGKTFPGAPANREVMVPSSDVVPIAISIRGVNASPNTSTGELFLSLSGATPAGEESVEMLFTPTSQAGYWGTRAILGSLLPMGIGAVIYLRRSRRQRRPRKYYDSYGNEHVLGHRGVVVLGTGGFGGEAMPTVGTLTRHGRTLFVEVLSTPTIQIEIGGSPAQVGRQRYTEGQPIMVRTGENVWEFSIRATAHAYRPISNHLAHPTTKSALLMEAEDLL